MISTIASIMTVLGLVLLVINFVLRRHEQEKVHQAVGDFWTWLALASFDAMLRRAIENIGRLSNRIIGPNPAQVGRFVVSRRLIICMVVLQLPVAAILIASSLHDANPDWAFVTLVLTLLALFCAASVLPLSIVLATLRASFSESAFVRAARIIAISLLAATLLCIFGVATLIAVGQLDALLADYWVSIDCRNDFFGCAAISGIARGILLTATIFSITMGTLLPFTLIFVLLLGLASAKILQFMLQPLLQRVLERIYAANENALVVIAGIFTGAKPLLEAIKALV